MNRNRIYIAILFSMCFNALIAQKKIQNRPYVDQRTFHFGFTIGLHTQDLVLTQSGVNENGEVWFSEIPAYSPGFSVGIIGDLYVNPFINLRVIPSLYLGDKKFVFRKQDTKEEYTTSIKNNYIVLPVLAKLSTMRVDNYKPYIILGGYGSLEMSSQKEKVVLLKPVDYGLEIGFGCDFYFPLFKLSPELKFCFGIANVLETDRTDLRDSELITYANALSKARSRMIVLSFNFE